MDIKIEKLYYYLRMLDGQYVIFLREQVVGPLVSAKQLGISFQTAEEAEKCVKELNEKEKVG